MTERDRGNLEDNNVFRFNEKARNWIAKGLVAATLFSGAAEVRAETPAPANPSATHSAEADKNKTEDDFPTTIEGYTPAPGNPVETKNDFAALNSILYGPGHESAMTDVQLMRSGENLKRYDAELVNCKPELKSFCFDLLLACDNVAAFVGDGITDYESTLITNHIKRSDIIKFGETGKGLKTVDFDNDFPSFCLLNTSKDVESSVRQSVKDLQKDIPDFLEVCYENGMRIFVQNKVDPTGGTWSKYDEYGTFLYNCDRNDVKRKGKVGITKNLKMSILTESFAIKARILGITQDAFEAVLKQRLASDNALALSKKTNNKDRKKFYQDMYSNENAGYELYLSMCGDTEKAAAIIDEVKRNNLIRPFGFKTWQEVDAILAG